MAGGLSAFSTQPSPPEPPFGLLSQEDAREIPCESWRVEGKQQPL